MVYYINSREYAVQVLNGLIYKTTIAIVIYNRVLYSTLKESLELHLALCASINILTKTFLHPVMSRVPFFRRWWELSMNITIAISHSRLYWVGECFGQEIDTDIHRC